MKGLIVFSLIIYSCSGRSGNYYPVHSGSILPNTFSHEYPSNCRADCSHFAATASTAELLIPITRECPTSFMGVGKGMDKYTIEPDEFCQVEVILNVFSHDHYSQ